VSCVRERPQPRPAAACLVEGACSNRPAHSAGPLGGCRRSGCRRRGLGPGQLHFVRSACRFSHSAPAPRMAQHLMSYEQQRRGLRAAKGRQVLFVLLLWHPPAPPPVQPRGVHTWTASTCSLTEASSLSTAKYSHVAKGVPVRSWRTPRAPALQNSVFPAPMDPYRSSRGSAAHGLCGRRY